jgi:pimeloyl-ACP methyl ester carboxylesterase
MSWYLRHGALSVQRGSRGIGLAVQRKVKVSIGIVAALAALLAAFSWWMGGQVVEGSTHLTSPETTAGVLIDPEVEERTGFDYDAFCGSHRIETVSIPSSLDGHVIPGDLIYADGADAVNKTVIMAHCNGGNRTTNYPQAEMFVDMGYNVLTYDQRNTNENTAAPNTFGYLEKNDIIDCIDYVRQSAPDAEIGVWGASMGGAAAAQAVGFEGTSEKVDWLILECPVSEMRWMVEAGMSQMDMGIPLGYMMACGDAVMKVRLGFGFDDASATRAAKNITAPTLVINSSADDVTPQFMAEDICNALPEGAGELWTVDDCGHVEMWLYHNDEYRSRVLDLIARAHG